jgi:hypothetical protein
MKSKTTTKDLKLKKTKLTCSQINRKINKIYLKEQESNIDSEKSTEAQSYKKSRTLENKPLGNRIELRSKLTKANFAEEIDYKSFNILTSTNTMRN